MAYRMLRSLAEAEDAVQGHVAAGQPRRGGDFDSLVALLDADVVLRADGGAWRPAVSRVVRGAPAVARQAIMFALPTADLHPALVHGAARVVVTVRGQPFAVMGFIVTDGKIAEIDAIADPERVGTIAAGVVSRPRYWCRCDGSSCGAVSTRGVLRLPPWTSLKVHS